MWVFTAAMSASAQNIPDVRINEFVTTNKESLIDVDGDPSDWIELHNATAADVDLSGYYLTDDPRNLRRWALPSGTMLRSGAYLTVFASGKARSVAGSELHTNFSLAADTGYLALVKADGVTVAHAIVDYPAQREDVSYGAGVSSASVPADFVSAAAPTKWFVPTADIGNAWQQPGFDDSAWQSAKLGLGFDYDAQTGEGGNIQSAMQGVNASVYLRNAFQVANPARVVGLTFSIRYEDGFVAYLNGHEIASGNKPATLAWDSVASASHDDADAVVPVVVVLSPDAFAGRLVAGENILAVQGMNVTRGGSDLIVYPQLAGQISAAEGASLGFFQTTTPGLPNGDKVEGFVADTQFSVKRGFFQEPFELTLTSATEGAEIRYTTDGSPPAIDKGNVYAAPIPISQTSVIRAAAFRSGFVPTNVDTNTYI